MREKPRETRHERGVSRSSAGIGRCSRSWCGNEKRSVATSGRRSDSGDTHQASIVYFFRKLLHNSVEGNLAEFLDLVKGGSVPRGSVLLIESIDRLSRDQIIPARNLLESILLAGIDVHTLQPERIYTSKSLEDVQSLILMILEFSRAHDYSQQLGNRISAAWSSKREKAKTNQTPLSKCPPAWLRVVDGKYEVIPERGKVVELIY